MLTDLPIGFWTSAMAVDFLGGQKGHKAADRLVALGVLSALPTAAAGLADWSDTIGEDRRLGLAHAVGNVVAVDLYAWSWIARKRGRRGAGVTLSVLGAAAATAGAYLGGHLAWRKGVNVDRHAWDHPSDDWVDVTAGGASGGRGAGGGHRRRRHRAGGAHGRRPSTPCPTCAATWAAPSTRARSATAASPARGTGARSASRTEPSSTAPPPAPSRATTCASRVTAWPCAAARS